MWYDNRDSSWKPNPDRPCAPHSHIQTGFTHYHTGPLVIRDNKPHPLSKSVRLNVLERVTVFDSRRHQRRIYTLSTSLSLGNDLPPPLVEVSLSQGFCLFIISDKKRSKGKYIWTKFRTRLHVYLCSEFTPQMHVECTCSPVRQPWSTSPSETESEIGNRHNRR